jgi:glutaredoxin
MLDEAGKGWRRIRPVLMALAWAGILAAQAVSGGGIYTWKDSDGNVHFGDRPPPSAGAESVDVKANVVAGPRATEQLQRVIAGRSESFPEQRALPVTIYTTKSCGYCKQAKAYFRANNIPFTERDIDQSTDAHEAFTRLGGDGVPLIVVGKKVLSGFSEASFERAYGPH